MNAVSAPLRVLILVSGLLNGLTGVILFRLLRRHLHLFAAVLGALVWMLLPVIYNNYTAKGLESVLSAFFISLLFDKDLMKFRISFMSTLVQVCVFILFGIVILLITFSDHLFQKINLIIRMQWKDQQILQFKGASH